MSKAPRIPLADLDLRPETVGDFVYIIAHQVDDAVIGPVKVGITCSVENRLASLQCGNPRKLAVAYCFFAFDRKIAASVERQFHKMQHAFRMEGEWFDLPPIVVAQHLCLLFSVALHVHVPDEEMKEAALELIGVNAAIRSWQ